MLAPRHLIFTAVEDALVDSRTGSFSDAEEALYELERRQIAVVLLTSRTRAQIEPLRRKLAHNHPFITESGGGIFFPDGYFSIRIPDVVRTGRYLSVALGRPYAEVCAALDEIADECEVGIAGFHHMSLREIAENTGLAHRDAELARRREFDEPFYFTSSDEDSITRFVAAANERGFTARPGNTFWHFSAGCDAARAVRMVTQLFREATHMKLSGVGIGSTANDLTWLRAVDHAVLLPGTSIDNEEANKARIKNLITGDASGPAGWNAAVMNIIR